MESTVSEVWPAPWVELPRGPHGLPRDVVERSQRSRLEVALVDAVAEKGYVATTVADIIARAGVSRTTFYQQFKDKEDCFLQAYRRGATAQLRRAPSPSEALATVVTDSGFACPARAADAVLSRQVRSFADEFDDPDAPEFLIADPVMPLRAFHAAAIPYIFRNAAAEAVFTADQLALSRQMIEGIRDGGSQ